MNDQLKADIKELSFAAGIADTFHGRNCCAALDRVEEALTHAIEHMKRGQWQPIETAPKDGTGVLLCISIGDGHHVQYTGSYHDGHWWVTNFSGGDEYWYTPTDWMTLPEPPQERKN